MVKFNKPEKLNGAQLRDELNAAGVLISNEPSAVLLNGNGELCLEIKSKDEAKAVEIVANHIGIDIDLDALKAAAKQSAQAKLAALGLTEEEVASILG